MYQNFRKCFPLKPQTFFKPFLSEVEHYFDVTAILEYV